MKKIIVTNKYFSVERAVDAEVYDKYQLYKYTWYALYALIV